MKAVITIPEETFVPRFTTSTGSSKVIMISHPMQAVTEFFKFEEDISTRSSNMTQILGIWLVIGVFLCGFAVFGPPLRPLPWASELCSQASGF